MRIQHNIMAMSAYRNYNTNTSAVAKNLEKLSSGYKINRAGDDAAGLAISEKMRAQITGLNAAQKNVKDGISLVKTAEGAMQEIQDMLNRMDYLATQSANGTYQNEVDREALQKEVNQLCDEINRIADSANFNGIKLLDGSLDNGTSVTAGSFKIAGEGDSALPDVGDILGTDTVLHSGAKDAVDSTKFSVALHNLTFANKNGDTITLKIGDDEFTYTAPADGDAMDAKAIASAFAAGTNVTKAGGGDAVDDGKIEIGGIKYTMEAKGDTIEFTTEEDGADVPAEVTVTGKAGTGGNTAAVTGSIADPAINNGDPTDTYVSFTGITKLTAGDYEVELYGEKVTFTLANDVTDLKDLSGAVAEALQKSSLGDKYTFSGGTNANMSIAGDGAAKLPDGTISIAPAADTDDKTVTGDYNKSTTIIQTKAAGADARLASTYFDLTEAMTADGGYIQIGNTKYTFTTDATKAGKEGYVVYAEGDDLSKIAEKLTDAAKANTTYTVGHDGDRITVTEKVDQKDFDLTTKPGIEKSLGFGTAKKGAGTALSLQIGDTSDDYNQLKVSVGDMHTKALGIEGLSIGTAADASAAINTIKNAINTVSSVRGDLGAYQNRLEHTANNLSVMAENITDAESSIRDTDIAEEMMSYTKNNILVQSAQAMLAQANQVPQGVLQLLG